MQRVRTNAERSGAAQAETFLEIAHFTEVRVRQREVELVQQSIIQGLGLRVFRDRRMGFMYTTDLRAPVLDEIVTRTIALAAEATLRDENRSPKRALPRRWRWRSTIPPCSGWALRALRLARAAEDNAFAHDKRVRRRATCDAACSRTRSTSPTPTSRTNLPRGACWLSVFAVATQGDQKRNGLFADRKRIFADLETPERVRKAARAPWPSSALHRFPPRRRR